METPDGVSVGYVDLTLRCVVAEADGYEEALNECLVRWAGTAARKGYIPMARVAVRAVDELPGLAPAGSPPKTADEARALRDGADDLALNRPGAATWAKRNEAVAKAPVRNRLFQVLRLPTLERNWRVGALGEEEVAYELSRLGSEWRVLHSVPTGANQTIDHVLICPVGVFVIGTTHRPRSSATVTEQGIRINGARTDQVKRIRSQATQAAHALGDAFGSPVAVRPVVVFVGLRDLTVDAQPAGVHVTTSRRLSIWLREQPTALQPGAIEVLHSIARRAHTWTASTRS